MIVAVTGHRPDKLGNEWDMKGTVSRKIYETLTEKVLELRPKTLITGMALGVDILFANVAIRQKIPFIAAIPCYNQENKWSREAQELYVKIINNPLCTLYFTSKREYFPQCMQIRNKWMVDNCDVLIGVWDGSKGGTFNCIDYAISREVKIERIDPKFL
jgi:uncharacterized phage-like protein YoqJ